MLVRGRRIYPRHLFPEIVAPWIQYKRLKLRVVWFFTTPIHIKPLWMTSVVAGIFGVMLTILLFRHSPQAYAAPVDTSVQATVSLPPVSKLASMSWSQPEQIHSAWSEEDEETSGVELVAYLERTVVRPAFNPTEQVTRTSKSSPDPSAMGYLASLNDGWTRFTNLPEELSPATHYRQFARPWNPDANLSLASSSDEPPVFGGEAEVRPGLVITRNVPEAMAGEPLRYEIVVRNTGEDRLEGLIVSEEVSNLDRVLETSPAADVSGNGLYWRIGGLNRGDERRLMVTLQVEAGDDLLALTEVRTAVSVSSSTLVKEATKPAPMSTVPAEPLWPEPQPEAVEPVSNEYEPPARSLPGAPRLTLAGELPRKAMTGEEVATVFEISNIGTAEARDVVFTLKVPSQLEHHDGQLVEFRIRNLAAGQSRRAAFRTLAKQDGVATVDGALTSRDEAPKPWKGEVTIEGRQLTTTVPAK